MEEILSRTQLNRNIWIPPKMRELSTNTHNITRNVFRIWDTILRREKWEYNSPLIPLAGTNFFPPGNGTRFGKHLGEKKLKDIVTRGKIKLRQEIKIGEGEQSMSEWEYMQLKHFVSTLPQPIREDKTLYPIEKICSMDKPLIHGISKVYGILTELETQEALPFLEKWESDIGKKIDKTQMIGAVYNHAADITTIEANYKCMVRWHMTPSRMNKIHPRNSELCWRNCEQKGTTLHIWWDCPRMQEYWKEILKYIAEITGETILCSPLTCLFHGTEKTKKQYGTTLVPVLLNAAKALIPKNWLHPKRPSIKEWIERVEYIEEMEYLACRELGEEDRNRMVWEKWKVFKSTEKFAHGMTEAES